MKTHQHENTYLRGWVEDGILYGEFKYDLIDKAAAIQCVELRIKALGDERLPALVDARKVKGIDKEARDYLSSDYGSQGLIASAVVIDSAVGKFLGNFFMHLNRPKLPLKIFNKQEAALDWLQQFKVNANSQF